MSINTTKMQNSRLHHQHIKRKHGSAREGEDTVSITKGSDSLVTETIQNDGENQARRGSIEAEKKSETTSPPPTKKKQSELSQADTESQVAWRTG